MAEAPLTPSLLLRSQTPTAPAVSPSSLVPFPATFPQPFSSSSQPLSSLSGAISSDGLLISPAGAPPTPLSSSSSREACKPDTLPVRHAAQPVREARGRRLFPGLGNQQTNRNTEAPGPFVPDGADSRRFVVPGLA